MSWFTTLTGIEEVSPGRVREQLFVEEDYIVCPDGKRFAFGRLETPQLSTLRRAVADRPAKSDSSTLREVVGDVRALHVDPANAGALFQVASQFNLLEMTSPSVSPEQGVGIYEHDWTQGPACAIACGGGTIYRNYFAEVDGQIGQSADRQIDCSADLGQQLGNSGGQLWKMQNGYLLPTDQGLAEVTGTIRNASEADREALLGQLRIGLQLDAEVTLNAAGHRVSQAYCSALPVAYGRQPTEQWADFAQLILDAAYEATFAAGVLNADQTGNRVVYLTLLGGGAFGNPDPWIIAAIERAFHKQSQQGLDVRIVSYARSQPAVADLVKRIAKSP